MSYNNQARKEAQARMVAAADQWNSRAPTPPPQNQTHQMAQWQGQNNASAPMIVTVTNPEDQQWLTQVTKGLSIYDGLLMTSGLHRLRCFLFRRYLNLEFDLLLQNI